MIIAKSQAQPAMRRLWHESITSAMRRGMTGADWIGHFLERAAGCRYRCLAVLFAAVFLVALQLPAAAQVVEPCDVPQTITNPAQRAILNHERSGVLHQMRGVIRIGDNYRGECTHFKIGSAQHRRCVALKRDYERQRTSYNAVAKAFNDKVCPTETQPAGSGSRKVRFLLDAFQRHPLDWWGSIGYLRSRLKSSPNDQDLRDALDYLLGMYRGFIAAKDMSNRDYQRGVQHWLDKNYRAAAKSFAQAVRDNPDDLKLYRSFAHAIGRQHATAECEKGGSCVSEDLPKWASFFGPEHSDLMRVLESKSRDGSQPPLLRNLLNFLQGMDVYAAPAPPPKTKVLSSRAHALTVQAINHARSGDYVGAARFYAKAYVETAGDKGILYFRHYWEGVAAQKEQRSELIYEEYYREVLEEISLDLVNNLGLGKPGDQRQMPAKIRRAARAPDDRGKAYGRDDNYAKQAWRALRAAMGEAQKYSPFFVK